MNKDKIKNIILIIAISLIINLASAYATNYLFSSNEVSYNNNSSGITSDNVQGAIDELYEEATNYSEMRQLIYPVGSIYISVTDDTVAKVEARYGGTWEKFGEGETLVGVKTSDTDFDTIEETGGVKSVTLTANQSGIQAHNTTSSGYIANGITGGSHSHTAKGWAAVVDGSGSYKVLGGAGSSTTYSTNASTHTHNLPNHTHSISAANAKEAHTNLQPYITVYMYKRVS